MLENDFFVKLGGYHVKLTIEWTYQTKKGANAFFRSDVLSANEALLVVEDMEQTGRVQSLLIVDEHDSSWTPKELRRYLKEMETEPHDVQVYFDGGFDHTTGAAGAGVVIFFKQNNKQYRKRINADITGIKSNNEAEYAALHLSITELLLMKVHHQSVEFFGDSQVVIHQMSDEWPVYEQELATWVEKIEQLLNSEGIKAMYTHIPRKKNAEADRLATQALQGVAIVSELEIKS